MFIVWVTGGAPGRANAMSLERIAASKPVPVTVDRAAPTAPKQAAADVPLESPASAAPAAVAETERVAERARAAVAEINRSLAASQRELAFQVDEDSGRTIVRVIDASSGEILRQFPSEEALRLASRLQAGEPLASLGLEQWS